MVVVFGLIGAAVLMVLVSKIARLRRQLAAQQESAAEQKTAAERCSRERQAEHAASVAQREDQWRRWGEGVHRRLRDLVEVQLPAVLHGQLVPALDGEPADPVTEKWANVALTAAAQFATDSAERQESARLAVVALARRVQTAAHRIQEQVHAVSRQSAGNIAVAEGCMRVDHTAAQAARHAQSMAVLCGEYPGQQWREAMALVDVGLAASGRITAYERVDVSGDQVVAVAPDVAEPLIHAVAELLANATQSSPPASRVSLVVRSVARGAVIEIDDPGAGVDDHRLAQMQDVVSGQLPRRLADLGEVPQTGLAVVGEYVRRHQLNAEVRPTPYGGLRAMLFIPDDHIAPLPSAPAVAPTAARPTAAPPAAESADRPVHPSGLPQRRAPRHASAPAGEQSDAVADSSPAVGRQESPEETANWTRRFTQAAGDPVRGEPSAQHQQDSREDR